MVDFIHRLRTTLMKLSSNYDRRALFALSEPLSQWRSTIATSTPNKSKDTTSNTPNGIEDTKKKNGYKKYTRNSRHSKSVFDSESSVCLKCRFRSTRSSTMSKHIYKKHTQEEREWLL